MDKLVFPLLLRNVNPGDRFRPLGMTGHQKVNKFFIDHKVPPAERRRCPLLLSDGIPVWLVGHRPGESAKLDATSRRAVKAEVLLA
jgi:tRNA(Ile)-lysidine synthase